MPCLLQTMDSEEVDQRRLKSLSPVASLVIHFSCGWVPHGIFCMLTGGIPSGSDSGRLTFLKETARFLEYLCITTGK